MKKLVIVDGNSLANRAFYAIPMLSNSKGVITNAVYGFTNMMMRMIKQEQPDYFAVAFDVSRKVFRHEQYPDYKAQRKGMPEELRGQMDLIKQMLATMNIAIYEQSGYEGDDVIGTIVRWAELQQMHSIVVTGDKDSLQLISEKTDVYLTKKGISELKQYDYDTFQQEYELIPDQIRDLKGLMGDTSDNIPGVPGVGEKTALKLLHQYGTVEELYLHLDDFKGKKLGEKLAENHSQALMSKELATIFCEVPLQLDKEEMAVQPINQEAFVALCKELELRLLLKDLLTDQQRQATQSLATEASAVMAETEDDSLMPTDETASQETSGVMLSSPQQLEEVLATLTQKRIILTVNHQQGNPKAQTDIRLGLLMDDVPYLIDCTVDFHTYAQILKPVLEDETILMLTDDSKALYTLFLQEDIHIRGLYWDSTLISYLLNPEAKDLSVDARLLEQYDVVLPTEDRDAHLFGVLKGIFVLHEPLLNQLKQEGLIQLYSEIELPLCRLLTEMELTGVQIDSQYLKDLGQELTGRIDQLRQQLQETAGEPFNVNSSKQLATILFEKMQLPVIKKTKTGYSTDAEVLDTLAEDYAFVKDILAYRQLAKLNSTYVEGLLREVSPVDGKVHTSFNQTVTATGRLSSTEPNLQNIPIKTEEGKRIRKAFIPATPGNVLVAADYSQIELRILAHMSKDPVLVDSFRNNEDIHRRTASEVFGVSMDEVTKTMRRNAKAVNFGIIYGQTDFGLSKELGITRGEAKDYITSYFERYSGVRNWIDQAITEARLSGISTTMMGRKRYIKDINSKNFNLRSFAERTAVNSPIQGTAADIIKLAMLRVQEQMQQHDLTAKMLLQVHDELIFEVPPKEIAGLILLLRETMEHVVSLEVPLKIDVNVGFNWYDMERV